VVGSLGNLAIETKGQILDHDREVSAGLFDNTLGQTGVLPMAQLLFLGMYFLHSVPLKNIQLRN